MYQTKPLEGDHQCLPGVPKKPGRRSSRIWKLGPLGRLMESLVSCIWDQVELGTVRLHFASSRSD